MSETLHVSQMPIEDSREIAREGDDRGREGAIEAIWRLQELTGFVV